jgi:biopolymer transport protein ExbD
MKIKRSKYFTAEVSTSSLNDIMFFLMLFFLIVSTMSNPNVIKVLLPSSKSSQNINKKQINLTVTTEKKYFIDKVQVPKDQLELQLVNRIKDIDSPTIILRFAKELSIQDLVDVLEIGNRYKIKMVLATQKDGGSA